MSDIRFNGRVVVVTGAGGGLGRTYALLFGARGAKVVVNDLGGSMTGEGTSRAADVVVEEIRKAGGEAVANYDSVEHGDKIIKTAMDTWGRVDIVINNAGILRDTSFVKMKDSDWDIVNAVHLRGSYSVSKAAWDIMREQKFGRIIMTTSAAGIFGNAGQANYSAAKLGIVGLANTLALEGAGRNIFVNTIAPVAGTRLTATVMPPELVEALKTEYIAPLVLFLANENCDVNGKLFEVGAGWVSTIRRIRTEGHFFPLSRPFTPEDIRNNWGKITDFSRYTVPTSIQDSLNLIMNQLNGEQPPASPAPAPDMRYDGKVVVVTGAGGGLGRTYALLFASRGAKVVVNDLGGDAFGKSGGNARPAQAVVDEIRQAGGVAVPNFDSVEDGEKIIQTALQNFGRVDIVINNAGILRDTSFTKMTDGDWDLVNRVHLRGSYKVTKAAWEAMREQGFGRIIMTTSAAGVYGNFGQANYSAAKLGILGLANTLAIEGSRRNVFVNTIAPVAGTRLTATVMPPNLVESLKTEYVAPLVMFLCHESSQVNGALFEVGAGWVSQVKWERTQGNFFDLSKGAFSPEDVRREWPKITDFSNPTFPSSAQDSIGLIMAALESAKAKPAAAPSKASGKSENVDPSKVLGYEFSPLSYQYGAKEVALYNLSIGAAQDPLDEQELSFVYENHPNFQALPTFGITMPFEVLANVMGIPGLQFNPMMLLHGEQLLEVRKPIPTAATITTHAKISGLYDKGKGVVVVIDSTSRDEKGEDVVFNQFTLFIRGIGGYGGDRGPQTPPNSYDPPARAPDAVHREKTQKNQALLYRLGSGDLNPIHADPAMAAMGGFPAPILHGMCTYGHAGRAVLKHFCQNDPAQFKSIQARMSRHVFPGETLVTEMWKEGDRVIFQCKSEERNEIVLANACVVLTGAAAASGSASAGGAAAASAGGSGFKAQPIFDAMKDQVSADIVKQVKGIYHFQVKDGPGGATKSWTVDLKNGSGSVAEGAAEKADCTITVTDEDCAAMFTGKLNPQQAFMQGKMKIAGNMAFAMKLQVLMKAQAKL